MTIGSIGPSRVSTGLTGLADKFADTRTPSATEVGRAAAAKATIADHVAAVDEQGPIRSASTTLGTLLDTYL